MSTRIYNRNGNVVVADPSASVGQDTVTFLGREVLLSRGVPAASGSGLLLPHERLVTSETSHEVVVLAVGDDVPGVRVGDRVVIYLGGDDGEVSAAGISAFVKVDGVERGVVPERFIWAVLKDGEIIPRRGIVLTERTPRSERATLRHNLGPQSPLVLPEVMMEHGVRATGVEDGGDQVLGSVTALYEEVIRTGPDVPETGSRRGEILCFSPSYMSTRLTRTLSTGGQRQYHLVSDAEAFFSTDD